MRFALRNAPRRSPRTGRSRPLREDARTQPQVLMVLENCGYPLDARVRNEAESLVQAGFAVEVLAPRERGRPARELIRGVRVCRFPLPDGRGELTGTAIEYLAALCWVSAHVLARLARSREGTLHVHNPPDLFFPLLFLARRRGWSTVFDHHDDAAGMLRAKLGRQTALERVLVWTRERSARASDLTITTNETQRALVERAARRTIVVRNDPPAWFAASSPTPPGDRVTLAFLGEIGVQDRVERAVEILALLVGRHERDAELLIIGDGPARDAVQARAQRLGVADRVRVTGWVPYEQVPALLASAHVGLDTAPMTEVNHGSTMVKIIEYLVVGLPVIASALRETKVTGGEAVLSIEEDSAAAFIAPLIELISSEDAWRRRAAEARLRGSQLQWPMQAKGLIDAYRALARAP